MLVFQQLHSFFINKNARKLRKELSNFHNLSSGITYFPHIFFIPLGLLLFSGDNGDCAPDSVPEDKGERSSEVIVPSMLSESPVD